MNATTVLTLADDTLREIPEYVLRHTLADLQDRAARLAVVGDDAAYWANVDARACIVVELSVRGFMSR